MNLRRFNEAGIEALSTFLDGVRLTETGTRPVELLEDSRYTEELTPATTPPLPGTLRTRLQLGQALLHLLAGKPGVDTDVGLWSWLSAYFFDDLCQPNKQGRVKPGERARWIPDVANFRKYYRHLLAGPYLICRAHSDDPHRAMALLSGEPSRPGEIAEQLAARQEFVSNKTLTAAATRLYIDPASRLPKRGAAGKGGGAARRLSDLVNQLDLTWDLYAMTPDEFLSLLPSEFDQFRR